MCRQLPRLLIAAGFLLAGCAHRGQNAARSEAIRDVLSELGACLEAYERRHGGWPPAETVAELMQFLEADSPGRVLHVDRRPDGRVVDPWGRVLWYSTGKGEVTLVSAGADGMFANWGDIIEITFAHKVMARFPPPVAYTLGNGWAFGPAPGEKQRLAAVDGYSGPEPRPTIHDFYARAGDERLYPLRFGPPGLRRVGCVPFTSDRKARATRHSYMGRVDGKRVQAEQFIFTIDRRVHVFTCTVPATAAGAYLPQFVQMMRTARPRPPESKE